MKEEAAPERAEDDEIRRNAEAALEAALTKGRLGDHAGAEDRLGILVAQWSDPACRVPPALLASAYFNQGVALVEVGELDRALQAFESAADLPDERRSGRELEVELRCIAATAAVHQAQLELGAEQFDEAAAILDWVISRDGEHTSPAVRAAAGVVRVERAVLEFERGDTSRALYLIEQVIELEQCRNDGGSGRRVAGALLAKAQMEFELAKAREAEATLDVLSTLLESFEDRETAAIYLEAMWMRGKLHAANDDTEGARESWRGLIDVADTFPGVAPQALLASARLGMAEALVELGDADGAAKELETLIASPDMPGTAEFVEILSEARRRLDELADYR